MQFDYIITFSSVKNRVLKIKSQVAWRQTGSFIINIKGLKSCEIVVCLNLEEVALP